MTTRNLAAWWRDTGTGKLQWDFIPSDPSLLYRTAPSYTPVDTGFTMVATSHLQESGDDAYHKWASTKFTHQSRLCWFGGQAPFRITMLESPATSYIGVSGKTQSMTQSLDATVPLVYNHLLPNEWAVVSWSPTVGDVGTSAFFKILVEDNKGDKLAFRFSVEVDDSKFVFVDGVSGNDSNAGTWDLPKLTFDNARAQTGKIAAYKTAANYPVVDGDASNSSGYVKSHIGLVDGVEFNTTAEQFGASSAASDLAYINITFNGSVNSNANCKVLSFGSKTERSTFWKCKFKNVNVGTVGNDNPACMFFGNQAGAQDSAPTLPASHANNYLNVIACEKDNSVLTQLFTMFSTRYVCVEENKLYCPAVATVSNGGSGMNFKASGNYISCRFNYGEGAVSNGDSLGTGLINFANQASYQCKFQEACYNVLRPITGRGISFQGGGTASGGAGQSVGVEDIYCYRNTIISQNDSIPMAIAWYPAGQELINVADNLLVSANGTNIAVWSYPNGYTLIGDNSNKPQSYVDASYKLAAANRPTKLGIVGSEIASTLVV